MSMRIAPSELATLNRRMTKWADDKERAVARANYLTAVKIHNNAKKRFMPATLVSGSGRTPRYTIGTEADTQGRLLPHIRQGYLRDSIRPLRGKGTRAYVEAGTGDSYEYAAHVEFGTRFMRPRPYLFPAAEEQRRPHKEEIAKTYRTRVQV